MVKAESGLWLCAILRHEFSGIFRGGRDVTNEPCWSCGSTTGPAHGRCAECGVSWTPEEDSAEDSAPVGGQAEVGVGSASGTTGTVESRDFSDEEILKAIGTELKTLNTSVNTIRSILVFFLLLWVVGAVIFVIASANATE